MMYQTLHGITLVQGLPTGNPPPTWVIFWNTKTCLRRERLHSTHVKYTVIHNRIAVRETEERYGLTTGGTPMSARRYLRTRRTRLCAYAGCAATPGSTRRAGSVPGGALRQMPGPVHRPSKLSGNALLTFGKAPP